MNILKFYNWIKGNALHSFGLFKPSCELEHMIPEPVVFEARGNDSWQLDNVVVFYKPPSGYIVYIYPLIDYIEPHPSELQLKANEATIICDVPGIEPILDFLPRLFNDRACRFGSLKEDGCDSPCCG